MFVSVVCACVCRGVRFLFVSYIAYAEKERDEVQIMGPSSGEYFSSGDSEVDFLRQRQ